MSGVMNPYGFAYENVAANQTAQVLGTAGAKGDIIQRIVVNVTIVASASLSILDGAQAIVIATGAATVVPGTYTLELGMASQNGAWSVTTGAGCTALCIGIFSV